MSFELADQALREGPGWAGRDHASVGYDFEGGVCVHVDNYTVVLHICTPLFQLFF